MNAPCSLSSTFSALPPPFDLADARRMYARARTRREQCRALAYIATLRAQRRHDDLAAEAQKIIDHLASRWTAWRETSP